jgi:predicted HAD superfamily Cof-like phosphohydrolase
VIYGAELALGIHSDDHFEEVHGANMRKLGPDGKPIYREDGKVLKPEGWTGPDHAKILADLQRFDSMY